jgi:hypothetical protein
MGIVERGLLDVAHRGSLAHSRPWEKRPRRQHARAFQGWPSIYFQ